MCRISVKHQRPSLSCLHWLSASVALLTLAAASINAVELETELTCDVLICGATPGGITSAVAAGRLGHSVVLTEYEDHIGGIVSNGLTNADIGKRQAVGGLFYEFTRRVVDHYEAIDNGNANQPNVRTCRNGYCYEAHVAELIFRKMLAAEEPRIQFRLQHELKEAIVEDGRLTAVTLIERMQPERVIRCRAKVFVDATYEGDLAAMAGAPYRVGRESNSEFDEPHAGKVYLRFGTTELLPGSTGEADDATEAYCFRFHVTNIAAKRVPPGGVGLSAALQLKPGLPEP